MSRNEMNKKEYPILNGIHIGEHGFNPEGIINEIQARCIDKGMNYVVLRPFSQHKDTEEGIPEHYFYEWAQFLAENKIYFMFLYTLSVTSEGTVSMLNKKVVSEIKRIAEEYFLGDNIGEVGSAHSCKQRGYYEKPGHPPMPQQNEISMQTAKDSYINTVSEQVAANKKIGIHETATVEATMLNRYNMEAGVTIPIMEVMQGNPEILIASTRGAAKAYHAKTWGTYIAHEWYGGMLHQDTLKRKRLSLAYKYSYIAGSNIFCMESGDEQIRSYGSFYDREHELCREYRNVVHDFTSFIKKDIRPYGGPKVKIAFVHGNLDGWGGLMHGMIWAQFEGKHWGYSSAEYSWRILEDISNPAGWHDPANFGNYDFSSGFPFGMYDILPIEAELSVISQYEYLIFVGWNTMTEEILQKLEGYVEAGGRLFMTSAHLNTNPRRDGEISWIGGGRLEKLFGCRLETPIFSSADGVKFRQRSLVPEIIYPGPKDYRLDACDSNYAGGYRRYSKVEMVGGHTAAVLSDRFDSSSDEGFPVLVENKLGEGLAMLLTTVDYPGSNTVYPLYKTILREILSACHHTSNIRVCGNSKVKFAVYENDCIYLLNTDYDCAAQVIVSRGECNDTIMLMPGELKAI